MLGSGVLITECTADSQCIIRVYQNTVQIRRAQSLLDLNTYSIQHFYYYIYLVHTDNSLGSTGTNRNNNQLY